MKGLGRRSPFVGIILTIGLLSLGGIPITGGFVSKLLIILASFNGANWPIMNIVIVIMAIINSLLALGGYLYILKIIVFDKPENDAEDKLKIPVFEGISLVIIALVIILLGVWPEKIFELIAQAVGALW